MAKPTAKRLLLQLLSWAVVLAVVVFFARTLQANWRQLSDVNLSLDILSISAFLCFVLAVVVSGVLWGRLLNHLSTKGRVSLSDSIRIHCASWLLKYIPGQAGSYLNKLAWGQRNGFTKKSITTSFIYENVLMVLAAGILSLPIATMLANYLPDNVARTIPYILVLLVLVILLPSVFRRLLNIMMRLVGRGQFGTSDFLSGFSIVSFQLQYLVPRLLNGVGFVLLAVSVLPAVEPSMYIGLGASYIFAGIVGLLAVFVPGGIGVRESVIVLLASSLMPVEQAIVLSLVARLYSTLADLGVAGIYLVLNKGRVTQL